MPKTSMVGLEEKYSTSIKKMSKVTKAFSKDEEEMEALLENLSRNKYEIGIDISQAEKELKELEYKFFFLEDGERKDLVDKQVALEGMRQKQKLVNEELKKAENYMQGITESGMFEKLQKSGALQMPGQVLKRGGNDWVTSTWGANDGIVFSDILSSTLSGITSGLSVGSIIPGIGTVTGAVIGAGAGVALGAISGALEIFEEEDSAFKSHIKGMVDTQSALRENEMLSGSAYAAQQEKALADASPGSMPDPKKTYLGMTTQLKKREEELNGILGSSYNQTARTGLQADYDAFQGALGDELEEMNSMIGEGRGMAENLERQYRREALSMLATGEGNTLYEGESEKHLKEMNQEYEALKTEFDTADEARKAEIGAQIEALKSEAESLAKDAYNASETGAALRDTELDLIEAIRANTFALGGAAWNREYLIQQEESKGLLNGKQTIALRNWKRDHPEGEPGGYDPESTYLEGEKALAAPASSYLTGGYAYGLERVPYDNFPALLHQGERVLTASQAGGMDRGAGSVKVEIGQVSFGSMAADPEEAAELFARELERELLLARPW